jgi:hypothetical protein
MFHLTLAGGVLITIISHLGGMFASISQHLHLLCDTPIVKL